METTPFYAICESCHLPKPPNGYRICAECEAEREAELERRKSQNTD